MAPKATSSAPSAQVRAASEAAREAPASVAALVLDVLSRQAEGKLLFAGKEHVAKKAEAHSVEAAEVAGEDVLALLERGPESERQRAVVAALMIEGLRAHLDDADRLERFARHADWLELSTDYAPYAFVDVVLEGDAGAVWKAVAALPSEAKSPASAARRSLRAAALAASGNEVAGEMLAKLAADSDPLVQAAARAHGAVPAGDVDDDGDEPSVEGRIGRIPPTGFRGVLRLVSGFAALEWVLRALLFAFGVRRSAKLRFVRGGLKLRKRVELLGRVVREGEETYTMAAIASVGRTSRWPALPLVVGALAFAVGVIVGGLWLFEGLRSGETVLLLAAAGVIVIGGGLDLGISILWPARKKKVAVELSVLPKRRLQLTSVPEASAEAFVGELRERVAR
ncbi:MAG: hypothetical protein JJ863_31520 [Deltaproteobacteria bacterium]|nr:hypothetical protein [Deltaproteobacteria bacterium]